MSRAPSPTGFRTLGRWTLVVTLGLLAAAVARADELAAPGPGGASTPSIDIPPVPLASRNGAESTRRDTAGDSVDDTRFARSSPRTGSTSTSCAASGAT